MPSSIKLSVVFTQLAEANLREVYLEEPWQDIMKDMKFTSPSPSLVVEDIAYEVESYLENIYQKRHGNQWGQLQVQVYKIFDQTGKKEFDFRAEVAKCLSSGDTVIMDLQTNLGGLPQQAPRYTQEMLENVRKMLRFGLNDRLLCYCGPRWLSGVIVGTAVPDDGDLLPYLVKTDVVPGLPSRTISVPSDKDDICTQEVCFDPVSQLQLVRCAAPVLGARKPKLRFAVSDKVVCRICTNPNDGLENWVSGVVSEIWPSIGEASWDMGEVSGKFPDVVPYKITLASDKWVYCHKDDHTLIRKEGMQPVTRVKGISKRMEIVTEADGTRFCIDHVTGRRKRLLEEDGDSD